MGVTFWGNFASALCLVPFHWRGMCYAHQFSRVAVRARSCRNGARIFDDRVRCSSIGKISAARVRRLPLIVGHSRDILYTPPKGSDTPPKGSAMFPCEEAKSDQSCREGAEPRRAGSPRDVGAWGG